MKSLDQYANEYFNSNLNALHSFYPGLRVEVLKRELEIYLFGVESHNGKRLKEYPFLQGHHQKAMSFFSSTDKGIPLSYITGKAFFYKNDFFVNPDVLIPRSETEILVEDAVGFLKKMRNEKGNPGEDLKVLEVGTGSGALILSLLSDLDFSVDALATDISGKALEMARKNYFHGQYGIHPETKLSFLEADRLFFNERERLTFDLIVSNPPYIKFNEINGLDKDVRYYEPKVALSGGIDGLSKIRLVVSKSSNLIKKSGKLFLEIGFTQTREVLKILQLYGFYNNRVIKDLGRKNRCIISTKI
mgnify:CR=1 FL=1